MQSKFKDISLNANTHNLYRNTMMKTFDFDLLISGVSYDDEGLEERLFHAGCDDATLVFNNTIAPVSYTHLTLPTTPYV